MTKIHFRVDFSTVTSFQQNTIGLKPFSASDGFVSVCVCVCVCVRAQRERENQIERQEGRDREKEEKECERENLCAATVPSNGEDLIPTFKCFFAYLFLFATKDQDSYIYKYLYIFRP